MANHRIVWRSLQPGLRYFVALGLLLSWLVSPLPPAASAPHDPIIGDHFGYVMEEIPQDWINANQSTNLLQPGGFAGPYNLGFTFRYYGLAYSQIYVNSDGFISLSEGTANPFYRFFSPLPKYTTPNNIIAPMWMPLKFSPGGSIHYDTGGSAPDRYFVVEWINMNDEQWYGGKVWFELVLHENGDIDFQYYLIPTINYFTAGFEDETGWEGLQLNTVVAQASYRFHYPEPAPRLRLTPVYQSALTRAGQPAVFTVTVLNAGDQGADTFNLSVAAGWPAAFFAADGVTPLSDTTADGIPDSGALAMGAGRTVVVKLTPPAGQPVGANVAASLVAASTLTPGVTRNCTLHGVIPAPFAQVFTDMGTEAMYAELIEPGQRTLVSAAPAGTDGSEAALAATPDQNLVYAWVEGGTCFTILDKHGATLTPRTCLTDLSGAPSYTWEAYPAVNVAPDGKIGLLWLRQYFNYYVSPFTVTANLFFAVLNPTGSLAYGPVNLTNNTTPTPWNGGGRLYYKNVSLSALGASRFALAWEQETMPSGSQYLNDIYYSVRTTAGAEVTPATRLTNDTPTSLDGYLMPSLTALTGDRALLTWYHNQASDTYVAVLDSSGGLVQAATNLTPGENVLGGYADAVQLTGGQILVAWTRYASIGYALLNSNYTPLGTVQTVDNPFSLDFNLAMSVTADAGGHAILTWTDAGGSGANGIERRPFIYYALVDSSGAVLTSPVVLRTDRDSLDSSLTGFRIAPYQGSAVDVYVAAPSKTGNQPGLTAVLPVEVGNAGGGTASSVSLVASLDPALSFRAADPPPSSVNGQTLTWNLSDLPGGTAHGIVIQVGVPGGAVYGSAYPVTFNATCAEEDASPGNNSSASQVLAARRLYLPSARR